MLAFEPAPPEDAAWAANAMTLLRPDEPEDPDVWVARAREVHPGTTQERWNLVEGGRRVGHATLFMVPEADNPEGYADVELVLAHGERSPERGALALAGLEERARAHGARMLQYWTREDDQFEVASLLEAGYRLDRMSRAWELDLESHRERLLAERERSRELATANGIVHVPLAARSSEADLRELYRVNAEAERDIPHSGPDFVRSYPAWLTWLERADIRWDRYWTAWQGERCLALSFLKYPAIGNVWTGFTGTAREARGRGIARGVKMETVGQAVELGVARIRTDNDAENAPMLHINEQLGYTPIAGYPTFVKRLA